MKIYLLNVIALRPVTMTAKRYDGPLTCIIITSSCSFREYPITVFFLLILLLQSTLFSFFFHLHFFFFFLSILKCIQQTLERGLLINICYSNDVLTQRHTGTGKQRGLIEASFTPSTFFLYIYKKLYIHIIYIYGVEKRSIKREAVVTVFLEWLVGSWETYSWSPQLEC